MLKRSFKLAKENRIILASFEAEYRSLDLNEDEYARIYMWRSSM